MPAPTRNSGNEGLGREIRALTAELAKSRQAAQRSTSQARRPSGGALRGGLGLAGRAGIAGAALGGVAAAGSLASAGIAAGTGFGTGVNLGAGLRAAGRSGVDALAAIPILGEAVGAGRVSRIAGRTEGRALQILEGAARAGATIDGATRGFIVDQFAEQERRAEDERQKVADRVNAQVGEIAQGTGLGEVISLLKELVSIWRDGPEVRLQ